MSLSNASGETSDHRLHQPAQPDCPLAGYTWRSSTQMPEGRLPRHVSALATLLAEAQKNGERVFMYTLATAANLIAGARCCADIRDPAHEVATLHIKRELGIEFDGVRYSLNPSVALAYVSPYLVPVSAR